MLPRHINFQNLNDELIKCLTKHIEQLHITLKPLTSNTKSLTVIAEISNIDKIRSTFEEQDPQINKINHQFKQQTKTRNFYPRPTPHDLQYEGINQIIQSKYDGDGIYEWNIDGVSEYQILNILQEMIMVSIAYKAKENTDHMISRHLIVGFTSQLKGWWDNVITEEEKEMV